MTEPVNGNQYYSQIITQAEQIRLLSAGQTIIPTVNTELVKSNFVWTSNNPTLASKKLYSTTGSSSSTFGTLLSGSSQFLNVGPNLAASTANALLLPPGATIVSAFAQDVGYVGGALSIGTKAVTNSPPSSSNNIFGGLTQAIVNQGGLVAAIPELTATSRFGDTGDVPLATISISNIGLTGITVTPAANITATNGLFVTMYYLL